MTDFLDTFGKAPISLISAYDVHCLKWLLKIHSGFGLELKEALKRPPWTQNCPKLEDSTWQNVSLVFFNFMVPAEAFFTEVQQRTPRQRTSSIRFWFLEYFNPISRAYLNLMHLSHWWCWCCVCIRRRCLALVTGLPD